MRWKSYLLAITLILILGAVVLVTQRSAGGFSVVYFDNSTIPDHLVPGNTSTIVFVIESHERDETTYSFEVSIDGTVVDSGNLTIIPGGKVQIPVEVSVGSVTYERVVLTNKTSVYTVTGAINVTGGCIAINSTKQSWICLPATYKGPSNLNFVLNTSGNVTVTQISTETKASGDLSTRYVLSIARVGDDEYKITVREARVMYVPKNVLLEVTVESSRGKVYRLSKSLPVVGG